MQRCDDSCSPRITLAVASAQYQSSEEQGQKLGDQSGGCSNPSDTRWLCGQRAEKRWDSECMAEEEPTGSAEELIRDMTEGEEPRMAPILVGEREEQCWH